MPSVMGNSLSGVVVISDDEAESTTGGGTATGAGPSSDFATTRNHALDVIVAAEQPEQPEQPGNYEARSQWHEAAGSKQHSVRATSAAREQSRSRRVFALNELD